MWGPSPIINIKYWSRAMAQLGYDSLTCVHHVPPINDRTDFDVHRDEFLPGWPLADIIRDFFVFAWALRRADIFLWYFDGGYLYGTSLRSLEIPLLRLAGKRVIVFPYGGDIAVVGEIGPMEPALLEDYPELIASSEPKRRRIVHICRWADLVIRNYQYGYLPKADVLWPTQIAIAADEWSPRRRAPGEVGADGRDEEVVVVHAPNHRGIKGTAQLIAAVESLNAEGLRVRLELLEGCPNEEVHRAIVAGDIVADQFIAGYAMFAIEGLSAGKPVMSALGWLPDEVARDLADRGCPIVDTDLSTLTDNLRALVRDPSLRERLGRDGRDFVLRCHAYGPVARVFSALVEHVWQATPIPAGMCLTERSRSSRTGRRPFVR